MEGGGRPFAEFLRRQWIAVGITPVATALALVAGSAIDRGLGLAAAVAVLFCVALLVGYRESQHQETERHQTLIDQIHDVEHRRATSERLHTWVPRVVHSSDDDETERRAS